MGKDFDPGGMLLVGRTWVAGSENYRFGFNGVELDDEIYGENNAINFGNRIFDPRLMRFFSVDPISYLYPENSPYAFCNNNPIQFKEEFGLGFNGGFSVQNNSNQSIILVGSSAHITSKKINGHGPAVYDINEGATTYITLEPGQRFEAVAAPTGRTETKLNDKGESVTKVEYYYHGIIKDAQGNVVKDENGNDLVINIYDVDGIDLNPDQSVSNDGEIITEENSTGRYDKILGSGGMPKYENSEGVVDPVEIKFQASTENWNQESQGLPPVTRNDKTFIIDNDSNGNLTVDESQSGSAKVIYPIIE